MNTQTETNCGLTQTDAQAETVQDETNVVIPETETKERETEQEISDTESDSTSSNQENKRYILVVNSEPIYVFDTLESAQDKMTAMIFECKHRLFTKGYHTAFTEDTDRTSKLFTTNNNIFFSYYSLTDVFEIKSVYHHD